VNLCFVGASGEFGIAGRDARPGLPGNWSQSGYFTLFSLAISLGS